MNRIQKASLAILPLACLAWSHAVSRELSLEERTAAQAAIERVYYAHQDETSLPFEAAVPKDAIEAKVRHYLETTEALASRARVVITPAMLRQEASRMEASSVMPGRLAEIRAALGNDAYLFEECVARPALADRLARALLEPGGRGGIEGGGGPTEGTRELTCIPDDTWSNGSASGSALEVRSEPTAIWTGSVVIIWGGWISEQGITQYLNTGGTYDPALDTWTPVSSTGAPAGRLGHVAVWTGTRMLVWGGQLISGTAVNSGSQYDPVQDSWTPLSQVQAPAAGSSYHAFWTGHAMLVYRGSDRAGARYDPTGDAWQPVSLVNAPVPRYNDNAVWTGSTMIVFGGQSTTAGASFNTGGKYDPALDAWTPTSTVNAHRRQNHAAVWSGREMIVWGGFEYGVGPVPVGDRYDPIADTWVAVSQAGAPQSSGIAAVWTGNFMVLWGPETARYALGQNIDDDFDGFSECGGDCNDGNAVFHPGAAQVCDGYDHDCDGARDFDADGDGVVSCRGDCDDTNAAVHPGAVDVCDGLDNDCSGFVDDAIEVCDGVDNDCDDLVDEDVPPAGPIAGLNFPTLVQLSWQALPESEGSDVVKGSLAALRGGAGDFSSSILACIANDTSSSSVTDAASTEPGQGFYYLVRGRQCGQTGTYDEGSASQRGSRDAEIGTSTNACP